MEVRQLTYFVKAAETLHFTDAAAAIYVTQSTLSQQIKQLEEELGMLLFDRIGKHVVLTEAGQVFLEHARRILSEIDKARQAIIDLNTSVSGELKIGTTYAFSSLLLPVLSPFTQKYPHIKILVDYDAPGALEKKLRMSELDFILSFHNHPGDEDLNSQPLFASRIVMVVAKTHSLAALKKVTLKEIGKLNLVLPGKGFISRDFLDELFAKNDIIPKVRIELNDVHSLLSLVRDENWVTVLNEKALMGWEELVPIPITGKELSKQSFILWQKGAYRKKAALLFVEEVFKKL
ncbi:LysR family transcriptional regulator, cyn operon transcriptional activator [Filimonas lacunae]|uniref:LysR family transcriptional regulator, cyn operon transcriptional activator n=1 Tax=Filimonas lacunae TaxID=477680 RepID=A0A173MLC0_9BACT|nr:LysR substrate-binding domain-containing protein [Filimonas lacunae]BAV08432.1 transcriptional regulator, LysR family [Filimonas lacunae]SIT33917.1 LysR family transcriptional regulator, cyn operon transcriptional activator [Filimonas lacunae]